MRYFSSAPITKKPKASGEAVGVKYDQQRFFCALQEGILIPNSMGVINCFSNCPLNLESPSFCGIFSDILHVTAALTADLCQPLVLHGYLSWYIKPPRYGMTYTYLIFVVRSIMNVFYCDICICTYVYIYILYMIIHVCTFVYIYTPFIHFYICQDGLKLQPLSFQSVFSSSKTSQSPHVARVGHETSLMHLCFEF